MGFLVGFFVGALDGTLVGGAADTVLTALPINSRHINSSLHILPHSLQVKDVYSFF